MVHRSGNTLTIVLMINYVAKTREREKICTRVSS